MLPSHVHEDLLGFCPLFTLISWDLKKLRWSLFVMSRMAMNTPESQSKLREHLHAFPSPPWKASVSWSFLDQVLTWLDPSPCEDFDLELEWSKLSLHLLPWPLTKTPNLSAMSRYPSLACWIFINNLLNLGIAFHSRFGYGIEQEESSQELMGVNIREAQES
jgi:hypothetical protein